MQSAGFQARLSGQATELFLSFHICKVEEAIAPIKLNKSVHIKHAKVSGISDKRLVLFYFSVLSLQSENFGGTNICPSSRQFVIIYNNRK